jgi:DNA-binding Lrp family transcriptional regulator
MDEVDLTIIGILWMNSRISIRELSDKLDLSVNSVHKRINNLVESGVIEEFILGPRTYFKDSVSIVIMGKSESTSLEPVIMEIGKTKKIGKVVTGLDNWVIFSAHLKNISDIGPFTERVVREAAMGDYIFGLFEADECKSDTDYPFSKLDFRIIQSLSKNSRKPISDVAEELGVSPKTVKRRLTKLDKEEAIYAGIQWQPTMSDDIISYMLLTLKPNVTKQEVVADLSNNYKPHFMVQYLFGNLPDFVLAVFWSKRMKDLNDIQKRLKDEGKFRKIVANVQYKAYHFDTWADEHLRKMAEVE